MRFIFLSVGLLASLVTAAISKTGETVVVNGINYYVPPTSVSVIDLTAEQQASCPTGEDSELVPFTVFGNFVLNVAAFNSIVSNYSASDDVFNTGFLQVVYLSGNVSSSVAVLKNALQPALSQFGTKLVLQHSTSLTTALPVGPYFLSPSTGDVYQAYRLYSDVNGAFTEGTIARGDGTYATLSAAISGDQSSTIGVPSRLYYTKTAEQPLAGVRLGVKDIYDIAGLKTGCGNRAYFDLYPASNVTGTAVQRLIEAGAVIVGKMKTSQFANGESATADWVDYHSPFNPRGDGYQDPSSSSSGPGAGIGAYSWLDIGLGSDTGGSIRGPSQVNGCYGNRPSHGLVALDSVMPLSPDMDTAGFLCRDPILWHEAAKVLYSTNISSTNFESYPKTILTSGFPVNATSEAEAVLLDFLADLQDFLGDTTTVALDLDPIWNATAPVAEESTTVETFMSNVYPVLIAAQQYALLTIPFYADYAAKYEGRRPFIDPTPLVRWAYGLSFGEDAAEVANTNRTIFKNWWESEVVLPDAKTCSDSIVLYPGSLAETSYRNEYFDSPSPPTGFYISRVSNFAEIPDFVFIIGQASYNSTITLQEEILPVSVDIMAAKGCDGMLFALAEDLLAKGILKVPKTGSVPF